MLSVSSSSNIPNYLYKKIEKINKEYNEFVKNRNALEPKNDGNTEIKRRGQYNKTYDDIFKFIDKKSYEQQKIYYAETSGMSFRERTRYIHQRYYDKNAPHYIGEGYTDEERKYAEYKEWGFDPEWKYFSGNLHDPMFRGIKSLIPKDSMSVAGEKLFARKKINQTISNILKKNNINIPKDEKLTFHIDPFDYKISVNGTDDKKLKSSLEKALNVGKNGENLFAHVWQTLPSDSPQSTDDIRHKNSLLTAIRNETGYNINELKRDKEKRTLLNEKGEDVFAMFEKSIVKNTIKHLSDSDKAVVIGSYRLKMFEFIDGKLKDTPDMVLKIDYKDGSLLDKDTTKGYGTGQTAWLDGLKEKLRATVAYNNIGDESLYKQSGNFFDSKDIANKIQIDISTLVSKEEKIDEDINLDPKTKAMKIALEQFRAKMIAIKVAKGQKLTKEELAIIKKYNPELLQKALLAHESSVHKQHKYKNTNPSLCAKPI